MLSLVFYYESAMSTQALSVIAKITSNPLVQTLTSKSESFLKIVISLLGTQKYQFKLRLNF